VNPKSKALHGVAKFQPSLGFASTARVPSTHSLASSAGVVPEPSYSHWTQCHAPGLIIIPPCADFSVSGGGG